MIDFHDIKARTPAIFRVKHERLISIVLWLRETIRDLEQGQNVLQQEI